MSQRGQETCFFFYSAWFIFSWFPEIYQFILHVVLEGTSSESFLKVGCLLGYDICSAVFWNDLAFILVSSFKEQNLTNAN